MITNQTEAKTNSEMLAHLSLQMIYSARIQTDVGDDDEDVDSVYSVSTTNGGLLSQKNSNPERQSLGSGCASD